VAIGGKQMAVTKSIDLVGSAWVRLAALCLAVFAGAGIALSGGMPGAEESLRVIRDGWRSRPASGQIVIAEVDAQSIAELKEWPWPRRYHAALVDKLNAAGAATVAFDVDFSSTSNPQDDKAFADALGRFNGTVVLPTFRQQRSDGSDLMTENLPIQALQDHAFLGSVNVHPDADGAMRNYSYGTVTAGVARPSLGALLASKPGSVEENFRIDSAIDPTTIPRISFADILQGGVAGWRLKGKTVLVGATAIEMGDRYATPGHGVLPGVVIQAMGAETLLQNSTNPSSGPWPMLALCLVGGLALVRAQRERSRNIILASTFSLVFAAAFALEYSFVGSADIVPSLASLMVMGAALFAASVARRVQHARLTDNETGLANEKALDHLLTSENASAMMAVQFKHFGQTIAVLSAQERQQLTTRMVERLQLGAGDHQIYALQAGVFGWTTGGASVEAQIDQVEALSALFVSPIEVGVRSILVTPAFGLAARGDMPAQRLIAAAALCAARAAEQGQRWTVHSEDFSSATDRSIMLLADLERAMADDQLWVAYQPKWDVKTARVVGAEALVRWRHPVAGPIPPDEFIPLLEQEGRLRQLTLFVVDRCLGDLQAWQAAGLDLGVAINISAPLLNEKSFVDELAMRVANASAARMALTLEVTESAAITNSDTVIALETLRAVGARVSIDDYGTGQSTLTYLKSFPADEIKIDKSFVSRMVDSAGDQVLVRSTIAMAHDLGFKVVAEGVEDGACLAKLAEFGCDVAQGWHIGKPMAAPDFTAFLENESLAKAA
jgi:EAL domain-containing protein (putative c-di-GMP-specific phosphodiesterase class I)/CHASE2 domain-containing sensor protein